MRKKDYIITIGSANMDVAGYSHELRGFQPGENKIHAGRCGA